MFWNKDKIPDLVLDDDDDEDLFREDLEEYLDDPDDSEDLKENIEVEQEEKEEEKKEKNPIKIINKILNIFLIILVVIGLFVCIDVICVSRFNVGPFFAIKTKTYNDGGSKEYLGLFYKIIKYRAEEGRVDTVIGSWKINYSTETVDTSVLDLALEFNNNFDGAFDKYMNNYLKVEGKITKINDKTITLEYKDEDKKYNTTLTCNLLNSGKKYKKGDTVEIVGTLNNYNINKNLKLYMKNCYIK